MQSRYGGACWVVMPAWEVYPDIRAECRVKVPEVQHIPYATPWPQAAGQYGAFERAKVSRAWKVIECVP